MGTPLWEMGFHPQFLSRRYFKVKHFSYAQNNAKPTYILKSILEIQYLYNYLLELVFQ